MYSGLKTSSHSCKAISSSIVRHLTSNSNFLNPGGLSCCNSLRVFLLTGTSALLRVLLLSPKESRSARLCFSAFSSPYGSEDHQTVVHFLQSSLIWSCTLPYFSPRILVLLSVQRAFSNFPKLNSTIKSKIFVL